jgi:hypothetical protein
VLGAAEELLPLGSHCERDFACVETCCLDRVCSTQAECDADRLPLTLVTTIITCVIAAVAFFVVFWVRRKKSSKAKYSLDSSINISNLSATMEALTPDRRKDSNEIDLD